MTKTFVSFSAGVMIATALFAVSFQVARAGECFEDPVYDRTLSGTITTGSFVRDVACMEGSVIKTTLPVGTTVYVTGETDGWYRIETSTGVTGWVGQWLLSVDGAWYGWPETEEEDEPEEEPETRTEVSGSLTDRVRGHILLRVEDNGEAYYVHPDTAYRYYMKDGPTAYEMMRAFGLGITDEDLTDIPEVDSEAAMLASTSVCASNPLAARLKGKILLRVQALGEAYYIHPDKCRRIYMRDGASAYAIMRYLSLGITNTDLAKVTERDFEAVPY